VEERRPPADISICNREDGATTEEEIQKGKEVKEHVEESDIDQSEPCATPILAKEGIGTFGRVRWSAMHCLIALGSIAGFQVAFYLLGLWLHGSTLYAVGIGLWILMVLWMALIPLWIAHSQKVLRRPKVRRIVKELALAIPVTVGLIVVERLVITFLSHVSGSVVETMCECT
jgi:hypothetical protein